MDLISDNSTITLRNILTIILASGILAIVILIYSTYLPGRLAENRESPSTSEPPHFISNIYEGKQAFSHPIAVSVAKDGKLFVSNNDLHTVEVLTPNGLPEFSIGHAGQEPGALLYPYGIGQLPSGNLLIGETGNYRIQEFTPKGNYVKTFIGPENTLGLTKPGPISIDSKGRIYIGELSAGKVLVVDNQGRLLRTISNVIYPHGLAVDEQHNRLYVSDASIKGIKVFSLDKGNNSPLQVIQTWGEGTPFTMVRGMAVDSLGSLYVTDTMAGSIRVFDKNGSYLFSFGGQGFEDGMLSYPNGIFIDSKNTIYLADWGNNRLQLWGY